MILLSFYSIDIETDETITKEKEEIVLIEKYLICIR